MWLIPLWKVCFQRGFLLNNTVATDKPTSLEEAFNLVQQNKIERTVQASSNPLDHFVLNLAKVIKEEKKNFVPPPTIIEEQLVEEEPEPEYPPVHVEEALSNLAAALQKAKIEAQQQLEKITEEEENTLVVEKVEEPSKPLLASSLEGVLSHLAEALQKAKQPEEEQTEQEEKKEEEEQPEEKEEQPEQEEETDEQTSNNPYVKELSKSTQFDIAKPKVDETQNEIKRLVSEQVNTQLEAFRRQLFSSNLMMGGGGGGTNAVQYAAGGTMNGNLNVNGHILSGGIDLSEAIRNTVAAAVADIGSITLPDPLIVKDISY